MSTWSGRILFFDGFAGRGTYDDGSEGSPIIALRRIAGHSIARDRPSCTFDFLFVERDPKTAAALREQVESLESELGGFPSNVTYRVEEGEFERHASALADQARRRAPTFAFIDPFGYTKVPMATIARLTNHPKTEVFINLMVDHLGRFLKRTGQEKAVSELFGMSPDEVMADHEASGPRHEHLRDIYVRQLRAAADFRYVSSFAMKGDRGHVQYYLLHGTRHPEGVKLMKKAMWRVDPVEGSMFSDKHARHDQLFQMDPNLVPLRKLLLESYAGRSSVPLETIRFDTLLGTSPYRDTHASDVIAQLNAEGLVKVTKNGRRIADQTVDFRMC